MESSLGTSGLLCGWYACRLAHIAERWIMMRQSRTSPVCCHPSLCPLAADTLTLMGPNPLTDTESQWYYSWNVGYVFSTNERMEKNKQRGQIKREKDDWEKKTRWGRKGSGGRKGHAGRLSCDSYSSACSTWWVSLSLVFSALMNSVTDWQPLLQCGHDEPPPLNTNLSDHSCMNLSVIFRFGI